VRLAATTSPRDVPTPDLIVVTVKAYQTERAIREAEALVGQRTRVLTLQNGLGNVEALEAVVPREQILAGATSHGVTYLEPGHVHHAGVGYLRVGSPTGDVKAAEQVAHAFTECGLPAEPVADVMAEIWAKVIVNVGINPITAITGLRNGGLLEVRELKELMQHACEEAVQVAAAAGVRLPGDDPLYRTLQVASLTAGNKSSMLQDIERGRRTEIDALSGAIVRLGLKHGVDTPVNASLVALVKGIEATTRRA